DARRHADRRRAVRHVAQHHGHGTDAAIIADADTTEYLRVGPDIDVVADDRHCAVLATVADGHALPQRTITAYRDLRMNEDAAEMPDTQTRPDQGRFW